MNSVARTVIATILGLSVTVCIFQGNALAKQATPLTAVKQKIDLTIPKMRAVKKGASGGMDTVKITVSVRALSSAPKVCSGPFKVKLEKDTGGSWVFLQHAGVTKLCAGKILRKIETKNLTFTDRVPSDLAGAQKYRAVVDYTSMVDESNEANNIGGTRYLP